MTTPAHDAKLTLHLLTHVQAHEPRETDPHYALFMQAKARIEKLGLMKCAIPDCTFPGPMELHHDKVEFSEQGGVDLAKFNQYYGLHLASDEDFKNYIEGEGNLDVLCSVHHRTYLGVHVLPGPFWNVLRVWKEGLKPPAEAVFPSGSLSSAEETQDAAPEGGPLG